MPLSRSQLFQLESLAAGDIRALLDCAIGDAECGLGAEQCRLMTRRSITSATRAKVMHVERYRRWRSPPASCGSSIMRETAVESLGNRLGGYDGTGDDHYDLASADQEYSWQ